MERKGPFGREGALKRITVATLPHTQWLGGGKLSAPQAANSHTQQPTPDQQQKVLKARREGTPQNGWGLERADQHHSRGTNCLCGALISHFTAVIVASSEGKLVGCCRGLPAFKVG